METYTAQVMYPLQNGTMGSIRQSGFSTVARCYDSMMNYQVEITD